jgi:hypothetical protein
MARSFCEKLLDSGNIRIPILLRQQIFTYFRDHSKNVFSACGKALCDIYEYSLPKYSLEIVMNYMYEPLVENMESGEMKNREGAGCVMLCWIRHLIAKNR